MDELQNLSRKFGDVRRKGQRFHGLLGRANGDFTQGGREGYQWVRVERAGGGYAEGLYRGSMREVLNLPVIIEYDPVVMEMVIKGPDPDRLTAPGSGEEQVPYTVQKHGYTHGRGYDDPIEYLSADQVWQNRVQPHATQTQWVVCQGGGYYAGVNFVFRSTYTELDLSSYYPATGAQYVLIYYDDAGSVGVQDDSVTDIADVQPPPPDTFVPAIVRLRAGVAMSWDDITPLHITAQPGTNPINGEVLVWLGW